MTPQNKSNFKLILRGLIQNPGNNRSHLMELKNINKFIIQK